MDKKKKIIFLCMSIRDIRHSTRYQRSKLLSSLYDVTLICRWRPSQEVAEMFSSVIVLPWGGYFILTPIIIGINKLLGINSIHTQYNIAGIILGWFAKKFFRYKWVYDLWDHPSLQIDFSSDTKSRLLRVLWDRVCCKMLQSADTWIIGMQQGVMEYLPEPLDTTKIFKVTNGAEVNSSCFQDGLIPADKGVNSNLQIGYVGAVIEERGGDLMLDILRELENKRVNSEIRAYGDYSDSFRRKVDSYNNEAVNKFLLYGNVPYSDVEKAMDQCHICLCLLDQAFINYRYAYPIKIFEYFSMGKIVIATRTPATEEIIVNGVNGFLVDNNVTGIINTIESIMLMSKKSQRELSMNAIARSKLFLWENINLELGNKLLGLSGEK